MSSARYRATATRFASTQFESACPATAGRATGLPGGHSEREPPDPIPNSEVKTLSADDSTGFPRAKVGHCQAFYPSPRRSRAGGFFIYGANPAVWSRSRVDSTVAQFLAWEHSARSFRRSSHHPTNVIGLAGSSFPGSTARFMPHAVSIDTTRSTSRRCRAWQT